MKDSGDQSGFGASSKWMDCPDFGARMGFEVKDADPGVSRVESSLSINGVLVNEERWMLAFLRPKDLLSPGARVVVILRSMGGRGVEVFCSARMAASSEVNSSK